MRPAAIVVALVAVALSAQDTGRHGTVKRIQVHGKALEGNLEGDSADREVAVYLPPSYSTNTTRRYPVVYLLHGFTDDVDHWWGEKPHYVHAPQALDRALAGGASETIVVMPDAFTRYQGSMYSNSATIGNWEEYVATELVAYVDAHYRTVASAAGRGLAGHSMGGYGAVRIGMKHPEVYSSLYALSPCCLQSDSVEPNAKAEAVRSPEEVDKGDFGVKADLAKAAAWSPNPKNPPLFLDLPYKNGVVRPEIVAKWHANSPLSMLDQYIANLRRYKAIAIDVGRKDDLAADSKRLDAMLTSYGVAHIFEVYDGDHINRIEERLEKKVMPFFSEHLK